jgi:uncharacterized protein with von Willebrand factor type A (vWA) domain
MGKMVAPGTAGFGNASTPVVDKREQRRLDQALGLVPFAVKINSELVKQLQALAAETGADLNTTVADVLAKGLAAPLDTAKN